MKSFIATIIIGGLLLSLSSCDPRVSRTPPAPRVSNDTITTQHVPLADSSYIRGDYKVIARTGIPFKLLWKGEKSSGSTITDTIYSDKEITLLGYKKERGIQLYKKYKFTTKFEDFKVVPYKGPLAKPDFATDPKAKRYITAIKTGCKELGINYAGHYTLITIGCGSNCAFMAIVDRINGKILYSCIPFYISNGCEFQTDSRLFILNAAGLDDQKKYYDLLYIYGDAPKSYQIKDERLVPLKQN